MSKRSGYAIALGLHAKPSPATDRNVDHADRDLARDDADEFYFALEAFLDNWRRQGMSEEVIRVALERTKRTSLAMEGVGQWLKTP